MKKRFDLSRIMKSKITWAVVAELLILLVCFIIRPDFFSISFQKSTGMLYGSLIDILNRSSEITIIALGMTLVIALAGTDLSVGALVAVSGALVLKLMRWDMTEYPTAGDYTVTPMLWAILAGIGLCALMGGFNGLLIAKFKLQPIIATLVLMVAGRGVAQIITNGRQMTTAYTPFKLISQGSFLCLPMPIIITAVIFLFMALLCRKTSFGMFVESVGVNPNASRVSGLNSTLIIFTVYMITGVLSGISGVIYSSRIGQNDSNNAGINYEMDAILAVVIGGTNMSGGKFSLTGTVIGSILIRTIVTFVYYFGVASEATMLFKALIVFVVIILQSEPVRNFMGKYKQAAKVAMGGEMRA